MDEIFRQIAPRLREIEETLHQNPELSFREYETTRLIRSVIEPLGLEIIDLGTETGVVARLHGGHGGKTIGLRADIDALKQQEARERPDRSRNDGVMHACGHDIHTTGLLGAAMALSAKRESLHGDVVFVFQPAEEIIKGAKKLIECGLFEKAPMDMLFGLHNTPTLNVGTIGVKHGPLMAAKDDFTITVCGKGGHGGIPDRCIDPVVAACGVVNALQTVVSRNVSPLDVAVLSICSIHGGTTDNLIVDEVTLTGSLRTMLPEVQKRAFERVCEIADAGAQTYGCKAKMNHYAETPPLINGDEMARHAEIAAKATVGEANVVDPTACMASDDFAEYGIFVPSFFYFAGSGVEGEENPSWHSAHFRGAKTASLYGAKLLTNSVLAAQGLL